MVALLSASIGLTVAGAAAYLVTSRVLHNQADDSLRSAPGPIGEFGPAMGLDGLCALLNEPFRGGSPGEFSVQLLLPDGTVCSDSSTSQAVLVAGDSGGSTGLRDGHLDNGDPARINVVPLDDGGVLVIARNTRPIVLVLRTLLLAIFGVVLMGSLIAVMLSRAVARVGLQPMTRFAKVAEDIAETGNVEAHAAEWPQPSAESRSGRRADELDRLSRAFAAMTSALADAQNRQRRLIADAGHELRTPLSSLRSNIALLRRSRATSRPLPEREESRLLDDLTSQLTDFSALIDDLEELAAGDTEAVSHEPVRLDLIVEAALQRVAPRATDHQIDVHLEPWLVEGHRQSLERAVVNLLDNAIKFSPVQGRIQVRLAHGVLRVSDRGAGLSFGEEHRVFERFWRSPTARSLPGSGLGLSIVHDVAQRHGGSASLRARTGGGVEAVLVLPGAPPLDASIG